MVHFWLLDRMFGVEQQITTSSSAKRRFVFPFFSSSLFFFFSSSLFFSLFLSSSLLSSSLLFSSSSLFARCLFVLIVDVDENEKQNYRTKKQIALDSPTECMLQVNDQVWVACFQAIHIFDVKEFQKISTLTGHSGMVHCLILANGKVWSCSSDKTIRIWSLEVCPPFSSSLLPSSFFKSSFPDRDDDDDDETGTMSANT